MQKSAFSMDRVHPKAQEVFRLLNHRLLTAHENGFSVTWFRPRYVETKYGLTVWYDAWNGSDWIKDEPATPTDWAFLTGAAVACGLCSPNIGRGRIDHPIWGAIEHHLT